MNEPTIGIQTLRILIDTKGDFVLIDVREEHELAHGMIPSAHHIPLKELETAFAMPPIAFHHKYGFKKPRENESIILYCRSGSRSAIATSYLRAQGYDAANYAGSVKEWSQYDDTVHMY